MITVQDVTDEQVRYKENATSRCSLSAPTVTIVLRRLSITVVHSSKKLFSKEIRIHLPKIKRNREQATAQNQSKKRRHFGTGNELKFSSTHQIDAFCGQFGTSNELKFSPTTEQ